ncbi:hypothetical protein ACFYV9_38930, partial [Streptomyces sp. NPDC002952]
SLMPLRLARYGVPLAETAPAGLAAAGIEPVLPPVPRQPQLDAPAADHRTTPAGPAAQTDGRDKRLALPIPAAAEPIATVTPQARRSEQSPGEQIDANGVFAEAYQTWLNHFQAEPTTREFAVFLQDRYAMTTGAGKPLSDEQLHPILITLQERYNPQHESTTAQDPAADLEEGGDVEWEEFFYRSWQTYVREHGRYPDTEQLAGFVFQRDGITAADGRPLAGPDIEGFVEDFWQREFGESAPAPEESAETATSSISAQNGPRDEHVDGAVPASAATRRQEVRVPIDPNTAGKDEASHSTAEDQRADGEEQAGPGERGALTIVDRYYLGWADYLTQNGQEPKDRQLSAFLAEQHGVLGRGGQGVSPSTLRRYLPGFRIYAAWSSLREHTAAPTAQDVARECATRRISVRKAPVTADMIEPDLLDFERRWQALAQAGSQNSPAS